MSKQPSPLLIETFTNSRRKFMQKAGGLSMSAAAVGVLGGLTNNAVARDKLDQSALLGQDIRILNTAIGAEHEAVAAYQLGAESGLLEPGVLKLAVGFQSHHKEHIDALSKAVNSLGGEADEAKSQYHFPVEKLKNQSDVLEFAAGLERGAVSAYANAIPAFDNRELSLAGASILADEAMHWAVLRNALGLDPVPGAFFS